MLVKEITRIINRCYPISKSKKEILLSSLFIAVMGYLFLIVFQPFGAYTLLGYSKYILLAPYSIIAFLAYSTVNLIFKKPNPNWSLYKELLKIFYILIICSVFNYVYNIYFINDVSFSITHLLYMHLYTFAIAIPVSMIYILGRYLYLTASWGVSEEIISEPKTESVSGKILTITPDAGPDSLTLPEEDFLFAESEGNYTTVYYRYDDSFEKQLFRLSLKNLEEQLNSDSVIRCHRSFIVNTNRVEKMKGNAQGYKLFIEGTDTFVPVSRKNITEMKKMIKEL